METRHSSRVSHGSRRNRVSRKRKVQAEAEQLLTSWFPVSRWWCDGMDDSVQVGLDGVLPNLRIQAGPQRVMWSDLQFYPSLGSSQLTEEDRLEQMKVNTSLLLVFVAVSIPSLQFLLPSLLNWRELAAQQLWLRWSLVLFGLIGSDGSTRDRAVAWSLASMSPSASHLFPNCTKWSVRKKAQDCRGVGRFEKEHSWPVWPWLGSGWRTEAFSEVMTVKRFAQTHEQNAIATIFGFQSLSPIMWFSVLKQSDNSGPRKFIQRIWWEKSALLTHGEKVPGPNPARTPFLRTSG